MSNTWARVEESLRAGDVPDHFIRLLRLAERSWIGAVASEQALPKALLALPETGGKERNRETENAIIPEKTRVSSISGGRSGTRTATKNTGILRGQPGSAAESAAERTETDRNPAEHPALLARLAAAWNRLAEADHVGLVELAERLAGG